MSRVPVLLARRACRVKAFAGREPGGDGAKHKGGVMPDSLRFLLIIVVLTGLGYAGAWYLANFPPAPSEVVKALPHDRFNN